jgi:hypothetical protein
MTRRTRNRRSALAYMMSQKPASRQTSKDKFFEKYCSAIERGKLIPIIGDTIRIGHIFDVNYDDNMGPQDEAEEFAEEVAEEDCEDEEAIFVYERDKLNIIEELAYLWGRSEGVNYPLTDGFQIARVAQFHSLAQEFPAIAKADYLSFLQRMLLNVAASLEQDSEDEEEMAFIEQLRTERSLTFSQIVAELDFPRFSQDKEDPLRVLARMPLKIYLTTSYHNFLERELEAADKRPRSRLCFWNIQPDDVAPEFRPSLDYQPDEDEPVVYHLLGMEQYPESLVLSEDDYLNLLWALARDAPGSSHRGSGIIPPYLEAELREASLLLLGYRLQDWDLRVLFRGLLRGRQGGVRPKWPSTAIQLNLADQPLIQNEKQAEIYLQQYFKQIALDVHFGDSDEFIYQLGGEWQNWRQGA